MNNIMDWAMDKSLKLDVYACKPFIHRFKNDFGSKTFQRLIYLQILSKSALTMNGSEAVEEIDSNYTEWKIQELYDDLLLTIKSDLKQKKQFDKWMNDDSTWLPKYFTYYSEKSRISFNDGVKQIESLYSDAMKRRKLLEFRKSKIAIFFTYDKTEGETRDKLHCALVEEVYTDYFKALTPYGIKSFRFSRLNELYDSDFYFHNKQSLPRFFVCFKFTMEAVNSKQVKVSLTQIA